MYTSVSSFLQAWKYESDSTRKILGALTDRSLGQRVGPEDRTLGRIAWHIVGSVGEMMNRTGLAVDGPPEGAPVPASAAAIAAAYDRAAASLDGQIRTSWTDETLAVADDMYGEMWLRGTTLGVLVCHQTHHRGQMTVLMRQAGLRVPGVYGPAREDWAGYGQAAPEV